MGEQATNSSHRPSGDYILHRLWHQFLPITNGWILAASVAVNILGLALPLLILQVYNRILPYEGLSTLALLSVGVLIAFALDLVLNIARSHLTGWAGAQYEHKAGCLAVRRLADGDLAHIETTPSGIHLDRLSSIEQIRDFYASQASLILIDLPFALLFLGVLALIAGWLVMVPVFMLLIAGFFAWYLGTHLQSRLTKRRTWDTRRYSFLIEALGGIHTVKSMTMESTMLRRYERLLKSNAEASAEVTQISGHAYSLGAIASHLTIAAVVGFGSLMVVDGTITAGALAAATLLAGRTVQPTLRALGLWSRFQAVSLAEDNLKEIDNIPPSPRGADELGEFQTLKVRGLQFGYVKDGPPLINGLDLTLDHGETIGIVGNNGVGKSTLLHLIAGHSVPDGGTVTLNGQSPQSYSPQSVARQIAYIPQRPVMFQGSVLDNLTLFQSEDAEVLQRALALAAELHLDEVFARMPDGYDTRLGNSTAAVLPAGVSQRIAIVRALLGKPRLILFDESNTSLDRKSDAALFRLVRELKKDVAMILVCYRPSLLALAERRFIMKDGILEPTTTFNKSVKKTVRKELSPSGALPESPTSS